MINIVTLILFVALIPANICYHASHSDLYTNTDPDFEPCSCGVYIHLSTGGKNPQLGMWLFRQLNLSWYAQVCLPVTLCT